MQISKHFPTSFLETLLSKEFQFLPETLEKATALEKERYSFLNVVEETYRKQFFIQLAAQELQSSFNVERTNLCYSELQADVSKNFFSNRTFFSSSPEKDAARVLKYVLSMQYPKTVAEIVSIYNTLNVDESHNIRNAESYVVKDNREIVYIAPHQNDVERLLNLFCSWWKTYSTTLPIYLLSSLLHVFFVLIRPFNDGNGRMARILALLPLCTKNQLISQSPSTTILDRYEKYYEILQNVQNDKNLEEYLSTTLEFYTESFNRSVLQYQQLRKVEWYFDHSDMTEMLSEYDKNLMRFFALNNKNLFCYRIHAEKMFDTHVASVSASYQKLVDLKIIKDNKLVCL